MKTQSEHNRDASKAYRKAYRSANTFELPTGVACDSCGTELHYTDQMLRLSDPPQRQVRCPGCLVISYVVA